VAHVRKNAQWSVSRAIACQLTNELEIEFMAELKLEQLTAIVDSREQQPWDLSPMRIQSGTLSVADYSIFGLERVVAIERKSLQDFVMCCGSERDRFQRELDRLRGWPVSAVIIEASWGDIELAQWRGKITSTQVMASFTSWIAQGHTLILGRDARTSALIARGILFYAARYRYREASALMATIDVPCPA
jgi:DNA excision repair protein ERCC-4